MLPVVLCGPDSTACLDLRHRLVAQGSVHVSGVGHDPAAIRTLLAADDYLAAFFVVPIGHEAGLDFLPCVRRGAHTVIVGAANPVLAQTCATREIPFLTEVAGHADLGALVRRLRDHPPTGPWVWLQKGKVVRLLSLDEIRLVVSRENYTELLLAANQRLLVRRTLLRWRQRLPGPQFSLFQRGRIVNLHQVDRLERGPGLTTVIHFAAGGPAALAVKRRHGPALRASLEKWRASTCRLPPTPGVTASSPLPAAPPTTSARPVPAEAFRCVLEGRHFWNLRTGEGLDRAARAFARAIEIDPRHAPAHAGLADVHVVRAMYRLADGLGEATADLRQARRSALRSLQLDPTAGEPHATLGFVACHEGRWADAARDFPRALARNPNCASAHQFHAWTLCAQGELERALAAHRRAVELDPVSFINLDRFAALLALARQYHEALAVNERAAALRPDRFAGNLSQRAPLLFALGRRDDAVAVARAVRALPRTPYRRNSDADAIFALHQAGETAEAADYARDVLRILPDSNHLRGFVLSAIARFDEALPLLSRTPVILHPFLYFSPMWDAVRDTPGFRRLIARLGRTTEFARASAEAHAAPGASADAAT